MPKQKKKKKKKKKTLFFDQGKPTPKSDRKITHNSWNLRNTLIIFHTQIDTNKI